MLPFTLSLLMAIDRTHSPAACQLSAMLRGTANSCCARSRTNRSNKIGFPAVPIHMIIRPHRQGGLGCEDDNAGSTEDLRISRHCSGAAEEIGPRDRLYSSPN